MALWLCVWVSVRVYFISSWLDVCELHCMFMTSSGFSSCIFLHRSSERARSQARSLIANHNSKHFGIFIECITWTERELLQKKTGFFSLPVEHIFFGIEFSCFSLFIVLSLSSRDVSYKSDYYFVFHFAIQFHFAKPTHICGDEYTCCKANNVHNLLEDGLSTDESSVSIAESMTNRQHNSML